MLNWHNVVTGLIFVMLILVTWAAVGVWRRVWRWVRAISSNRQTIAVPMVLGIVFILIPGLWWAASDRVGTWGLSAHKGSAAPTTCGSICAPVDPVTVTVPAAKGWVTILANSGTCPLRCWVEGEGKVTGGGRDYGPSGQRSQRAGDMTPYPAGPRGALLGYVSNGSPTIVVGKGERVTLPPGTELMCAVNLRVGSAFGEFAVTMSDFVYLE